MIIKILMKEKIMKKIFILSMILMMLMLVSCSHNNNPLSPVSNAFRNKIRPSLGTAQFVVFEGSNPTSGKDEVWYVKTDGTGARKIYGDTEENDNPYLLPDGSKVVWERYNSATGEDEIWIANIDGSSPAKIKDGSDPKVSLDGEKILYYKNGTRIMNIDGSGDKLLANASYKSERQPFSPDGNKIVLAFTNASGRGGIATVNIDGTGLVTIKLSAEDDFYEPHWSPDGSQIACQFVDNSQGKAAVYLMNSDGSDGQALSAFHTDGYGCYVWRPYQNIMATLNHKSSDPTLYSIYRLTPSGTMVLLATIDIDERTGAGDQNGCFYHVSKTYQTPGVPVKFE